MERKIFDVEDELEEIVLTMNEKKMDALELLHGKCHYFAIALAKKFGYDIMIWQDNDLEFQGTILCHAFAVTENANGKTVYIDVRGVFDDLVEIQDDFDYFETPEFERLTLKEAKRAFKFLKIPYKKKKQIKFAKMMISNYEEYYTVKG